jgi:hypothetical protein
MVSDGLMSELKTFHLQIKIDHHHGCVSASEINLYVFFQFKPNPPISLFIYLRCVSLNIWYFVIGVTYKTASAPPSKTIFCAILST